MQNVFNLNRTEQHFRNVLLYAPAILGNDAVNFFLDRFKQQAWLGATAEPWKKRKEFTRFGATPRNEGRAILVDTGRLRRSIRVTSVATNRVTIGTDVPYARMHNEGFNGTITQTIAAHERNNFHDSQQKVRVVKTLKKSTKIVIERHYNSKVSVRQHTRTIKVNMPRRQFMGQSPYLTTLLSRRLTAELMKGLPR